MQPAKERAPAVPVAQLPADLPTVNVPEHTDHAKVVRIALKNLDLGLRAASLTDYAQWRDLLAFTGSLRTFFGPKCITAAWKERSKLHEPANFYSIPGASRIVRRGPKTSWVQGAFSFTTHGDPQTRCSGLIGLVPDEDSSSWKIWVITTYLEQIYGLENVDVLEPLEIPEAINISDSHLGDGMPSDAHQQNDSRVNFHTEINGYANSNEHSMTNGHSVRSFGAQSNGDGESHAGTKGNTPVNGDSLASTPVDFNCVVCGGGQAGLMIAGRLKAAGVTNCIALDRHDVIGGNWLTRYDSVKLHTSKDISQLPFGKIFPPEDPYYLSKYHLADGYQKFVKQFGLNIWTSTVLEHASYDESKKAWVLDVVRNGERLMISTKHFVLALGPGGTVPRMPTFPNKEVYRGEVLHSINYMNCKPWAGKKGVIIGSANTAHDIAVDMLEAGLESVTLVQRNKTCIVPAEYMRANIEPLYDQNCDIEAMDRVYQGMPTASARQMINRTLNAFLQKESERLDALEKVGFKVERDIDMIHILYERVGGHHMDVGASAKVASGEIKVKSDALVSGYTPTGLAFENGSSLDADVIIFATGYVGNPRDQVANIIGAETEAKLEDMWSCDKEGEIRGLWKPIGHPGIWYAGGGIGQTRFYSRFLALQIQADLAGTPLSVYLDTPRV